MAAARPALVFTAFAAACSPSSPQSPAVALPDLIASGSCSRHEETPTLAVVVANRGAGTAAPFATRVEFDADPAAGMERRNRLIAPRAVDAFDVELPAVCSQIACRWTITVDSPKPIRESGRC